MSWRLLIDSGWSYLSFLIAKFCPRGRFEQIWFEINKKWCRLYLRAPIFRFLYLSLFSRWNLVIQKHMFVHSWAGAETTSISNQADKVASLKNISNCSVLNDPRWKVKLDLKLFLSSDVHYLLGLVKDSHILIGRLHDSFRRYFSDSSS